MGAALRATLPKIGPKNRMWLYSEPPSRMPHPRSPAAPPPLPPLPRITLRPAADAIAKRRDFLALDRVDLVATYADGTTSEPFAYDAVVRKSMDAAVILAYRIEDGVRRVFVRSALRPPVTLRFGEDHGGFWELPAGLIDEGEWPREAAARELEEEVGFRVEPSRFAELGPHAYPAPALIAERHYFFAVDVTNETARTPSEDGSPLERGASIVHRAIDDLLAACRAGAVPDSKTELALRRFAEWP